MVKTMHLFIVDTSLFRTLFLRTNDVRYREVPLHYYIVQSYDIPRDEWPFIPSGSQSVCYLPSEIEVNRDLFRFSPNGKMIAVGTEDRSVDFYDFKANGSLRRMGYCKSISSFVTQMDYSADSKYLQVPFLF